MKKIIEAYSKGIEGDDLAGNSKRRHRLAHRLGKTAGTRIAAANQALGEAKKKELEDALSASTEPNRRALEIIRESAKMRTPGEPNPVWGTGVIKEGGNGPEALEWVTSLSHGPDQDSSRKWKMPAVELPALMIDGESIAVDNLTIHSHAPIKGGIKGAETTVWLNTREYDPEQKLSGVGSFTEGVRIDIATDGKMAFARTSDFATGYEPIKPAETNVGSFLDDVHGAVVKTAQAYEEVRHIADSGLPG